MARSRNPVVQLTESSSLCRRSTSERRLRAPRVHANTQQPPDGLLGVESRRDSLRALPANRELAWLVPGES